mmetsp:Transcript_12033/g.20342  ORF Transcript_12033/g.20342 Transcript_12033/m.20342 type:complete len:121 (+) Transcript_12033:546-908(+)
MTVTICVNNLDDICSGWIRELQVVLAGLLLSMEQTTRQGLVLFRAAGSLHQVFSKLKWVSAIYCKTCRRRTIVTSKAMSCAADDKSGLQSLQKIVGLSIVFVNSCVSVVYLFLKRMLQFL